MKSKKIKFRHKHPIIYTSFWVMLLGTISVGLIATLYVSSVLEDVPSVNEYMLKSDGTSNMYAKDGTLIWSDTKVRRDYVTKENIPTLYKDALLSTEDRTFYTDGGFSVKGLVNAGLSSVMAKIGKGQARGGSTLEQQIIKNIVFSTDAKDRTVNRKIKELWLAQQLTQNFDKEQILEWYINKINMGENSHGAETIALTYYGKRLNDMADKTPENIAMLSTIAGLGQAPSYYNLYDNAEATQKRRDEVIYSLFLNEKITEKEMKQAMDVPIEAGLKERYWRNKEVLNQTIKYDAYVNSTLNQVASLGYDMEKTPLQIYTNLDTKQNDWLREQVKDDKYYKDNGQEVAVTVMKTNSSDVTSQVGGRNVKEAYSLNRATQESRSTGSIIKPFLSYAPAIEYLGLSTDYMLDTSPYTYKGTNLVATNYGGASYGDVTMQEALRQSHNTPAIRLLDDIVGEEKSTKMAHDLGLTNKELYGGSDALGINASTSDMASAFASIGDGGEYRPPNYIDYLEFSDGSKKDIKSPVSYAMSESTAYLLLQMMKGVPNKGTLKDSYLDTPNIAVKTGSVAYDKSIPIDFYRPDKSMSDSWIGGVTKSYTVVTWTGYDKPNEEGNWVDEDLANKHYLFQDVMNHVIKGEDISDWKQPGSVSKISGKELNSHYARTDFEPTITVRPSITGDLFNSDYEWLINQNMKDVVIKDNQPKSIVPKDYKIGEWMDDLDKEESELYNKWSSGEAISPEFDVDGRIFSN